MPILLTGSTGRLGTELNKHLTNLICPTRLDLDLSDHASVSSFFSSHKPSLIVHTAAYTNVSGAEDERLACWQVNVEGTRFLVEAARRLAIPFVHISTDYVFFGDVGNYKEDDTLGPVRNYYSLTKLIAEESVRTLEDFLIIRTSFRPSAWPYPKAFDDVYTSQDYVDVLAPEIALAINNYAHIPFDTLHIASERKSVFDLAKRRKSNVERGSKKEANVVLPDDVSLNINRWQAWKEERGKKDA